MRKETRDEIIESIVTVLVFTIIITLFVGIYGGVCWLLCVVAGVIGLPKWFPFLLIFSGCCIAEILSWVHPQKGDNDEF